MSRKNWTLLSNHGVVFFVLAANSDLTLRELAQVVGITERRVHNLVKDLAAAGYITIGKRGNHNVYFVHPDLPFRHPAIAHLPLREVADVIVKSGALTQRHHGRPVQAPTAG